MSKVEDATHEAVANAELHLIRVLRVENRWLHEAVAALPHSALAAIVTCWHAKLVLLRRGSRPGEIEFRLTAAGEALDDDAIVDALNESGVMPLAAEEIVAQWLGGQPSEGKTTADATEPQFDAVTKALAILAKSPPGVKVKDIAKGAGCTDKYLYAHPTFGPAWEAFKNANRRSRTIRRGSKSKDGTIEAVDEVEFDPD